MEEKENLRTESFEDRREESIKQIRKMLFEAFLPPKELRDEVMKELLIAEESFWKAIKAIVDYKINKIESKVKEKEPKVKDKKAKKIEIE